MLEYTETRIGILRLIESFFQHASPASVDSDLEITSRINNSFKRILKSTISNDFVFQLEALSTIKRILISYKATKNVFREANGYEIMLTILKNMKDTFNEYTPKSDENKTTIESSELMVLRVLQVLFLVIAESIQNCNLNRKAFSKYIIDDSIITTLLSTGAFQNRSTQEHVFGILFAFAIKDESTYDLFLSPHNSGIGDSDIFSRVEAKLQKTRLQNPEIITVIFKLQGTISKANPQLSKAVLCGLHELSQGCRENQIKMSKSGLVMELIKRSFPELNLLEDNIERDAIIDITKSLTSMGMEYNELKYLFQRFNVTDNDSDLETSPGLLDLILSATSRSRWPNFIQFHSREGAISCLKITPSIQFPPPSPGYTLLSWIFIEKQCKLSTVSLFSVWDDKNLLFKIYIDAESKNLHVYNPISKQESIFKNYQFRTSSWYCVALVHQKSRLKSSSMALYVNGTLIESISCSYLNRPQASDRISTLFLGDSENEGSNTKGSLIWNLGPAYLIQDVLEKETINLHFNFGARCASLFQDKQRQFQIYKNSAALYLYQTGLSRKSKDHLTIESLLRNARFQNIPENKILFAFFACNSIAEGFYTETTLSSVSVNSMKALADKNGDLKLILNAAIPKVEKSLAAARDMGHLVGEPIVACPFGLDESIWKIRGCSVAFKIIERSSVYYIGSSFAACFF